jgi:hypothetical protein
LSALSARNIVVRKTLPNVLTVKRLFVMVVITITMIKMKNPGVSLVLFALIVSIFAKDVERKIKWMKKLNLIHVRNVNWLLVINILHIPMVIVIVMIVLNYALCVTKCRQRNNRVIFADVIIFVVLVLKEDV